MPLYVLGAVLTGSRLQFGDYYYMLASIFSPDGSFLPAGLLVHANEHLIAVPKLFYAANAKVFGGSNIALGVLAWLVSLGVATLLWLGVRSMFPPRSAAQGLIIWAIAVVAFPLSAMHNYTYGMSGVAWLTANAFALLAILLAVRQRSIAAGIAGALATFSYGTGLAVWPALLAIVVIRRRRPTPQDMAMMVIGLVAIAIQRLTAVPVYGHPTPTRNPLLLLRSLAIEIGSFFTQVPDTAVLLGATCLIGLIYSSRSIVLREPGAAESFILGVALYALSALLFIAVTRAPFGDESLTVSRYMSLAALAVISTMIIGYTVLGGSKPWQLVVATGLACALLAAVPTMQHFREAVRDLNVAAIAVRLGVADATYLRGLEENSTDLLRTLGSYPFNAEFGYDCGLIGTNVEGRVKPIDPAVVSGTVDDVAEGSNPEAVNISGWAYSPSGIDCIVFIDAEGDVVGAGVQGVDRQDVRAARQYPRADVGFAGVALRESGKRIRAAVTLEGSDHLHLLDPPLGAEVP